MRIADSYELSPTQEGMLFHALLGESSGVDLEQIVCSVPHPFDEAGFVAAFRRVASRHAILRTRFSYEGGKRPAQEVLESVEIPVERLALGGFDAEERKRRFEDALRLDRRRGIDLRHAPAMRLLLVDGGADGHRVVWTFHHALLDGRSFPIVLREVFTFYEAALEGREVDLPLPRPYRQYIEFLRSLDLKAAGEYWRRGLAGFTAPTPLAVDHSNAAKVTDDVQGVTERRLTSEGTSSLRSFAEARGVTLNTLLQAAWAIVLSRYSGDNEVVFGATRACRRSAFTDADSMVGLFINTLPLRLDVDPERRLENFLADVRARQVGLRDFEHTPLVKVQSWSEVPRGRALFDTILVFENRTLDAILRSGEGRWDDRRFTYHGQTNYPLTLIAYGDDEMLVRLENDRRRVGDAAAIRMLGHVLNVLAAMPAAAGKAVGELSLLEETERCELLERFNPRRRFAPRGCLHELFEAQAARTPEAVAATCDGESLSYAALNRRSNALARRLRGLGIGPDALVALRTDRSLSIAVGILGILKAGGAYLPLDPSYPRDRVQFMMEDSGAAAVVTERAFAEDFAASGTRVVLLADLGEEFDENLPSVATPENLAYVIYTSGSTGKPKGALVTHFNVTRLFAATEEWFGFTERDVWTLFHSYAFDFSVWELWGALLSGGRVVIVPYWVGRSPEAYWELLLREGVTVLNQTPSAFRQLVQADIASGPPRQTRLRYVVFGGEALELQSLRPWFERHGDSRPRLVNMYGITETTVHVTYRPIGFPDLETGAGSVIGEPIPDLRLYLLDPGGEPVPIGVPGEIYVGGAGVSRGYLNRRELTAQRFLPDRFEGGGGRLYRSGDLARRLENGDVEYLGRIDQQVKIRGFRIELGEIETLLAQHPAVGEAVVLAREDRPGDKRLVAYLAVKGDTPDLVTGLRTHLKTALPDYMVPAHFVVLDKLPLTANGKVDRRTLPAPDYGQADASRAYVAARTAEEKILAEVWSAVLRVPRVGIDDNFFELGGDSILSIQVIGRCRQAGLHLTPRELAHTPTIRGLAETVGKTTAVGTAIVASDTGEVTPTPIQCWFFEQEFAAPNHWNQAFLFETPGDLEPGVLEQALGDVCARHGALRLRVEAGGLRILEEAPAPRLAGVDLGTMSRDEGARAIAAAAERANAGLDLEQGPIVAAFHFTWGDGPGRLLLVVHHIAIDGVSWRILLEDLERAYEARRGGQPVEWPHGTASLKRWSEALRAYAASDHAAQSAARWVDVGRGGSGLEVNLSARGLESSVRETVICMGEQQTEALLRDVPAAYRTRINDVLVAALGLALKEWSGGGSVLVELEGHGREDVVGVDVSRTVGWFTTLYPIRLELAELADEATALKRIKEMLREAPDGGLGYGALRYLSADPAIREELAKTPPAFLLFNYLGQFDQVVAGLHLFRFASEPSGPWHGGQNRRTHPLEVVALVKDGRFEARFLATEEVFDGRDVAGLARSFQDALTNLIRHCTAPGAGGLTPSDVPAARLDQAALDRLAAAFPGMEDVCPLTEMQKLFLSVEQADSSMGLEHWRFRLRGLLDGDALGAAWNDVVDRHAILRTAFASDFKAEPLQIVLPSAAAGWIEQDLRGVPASQVAEQLEAMVASERRNGFDLRRPPLSRVALARIAGDEHVMVWTTHHLCIDGWSWPLVLRDVGTAYIARRDGRAPQWPAPLQYGGYIRWLEGDAPDSSAFWREQLAGWNEPTPLPYRSEEGARRLDEVAIDLPSETTQALLTRARGYSVTLNTLTQAAWALVLGHASGRADVVLGAAFSGRPAELRGIETLVGPCVNNLPVRVGLRRDRELAGWLGELHQKGADIAANQYTPLSRIQEVAGVPWRLRLFDSLVVFQNYQVDETALRWGNVIVDPVETPEATNYPLTISATPGPHLHLRALFFTPGLAAGEVRAMLADLRTALTLIAFEEAVTVGTALDSLAADSRGFATGAVAGPLPVAAYVAPHDEMEKLVAGIWQELFDVERVGLDHNFFDMGGHSMLLLQAHARLSAATGTEIPVVALLQHPTVRSLARHLAGGARPDATQAVRDRAQAQREALSRRRAVGGRR